MKAIWVDLTDLFEWRGYATGIQRVTYNYATNLQAEGARFFVYSNLYNRFIEVPLDIIQLQEPDDATPQITKRQAIKKQLRANYKLLPKPVRSFSSPLLGQANKVFRKGAAMVLDNKHKDHQIRSLPTVQFAENDRVIVLGAGWNSRELIDKLALQKAQHNLKIVLHLNDILPVYQPHLFAKELPGLFTRYISKALPIADVVTVISKATKNDVERYCTENKLAKPAVEVIRLGEDVTDATPVKPAKDLADSFILCVGTMEIRKNYQLLYQTVKLAQSEGKELPQIVIAGRKGWLTGDLQYVLQHDPAVADKLIVLEKMSDANLSWLYENCQFTVFCSLAEGWGLPIAESLHHGKFCLSSNTSSMPEIAGDTIDYFNPFDTRECLEKISHYAAHDAGELSKKLKSYPVFTWQDSYEQLKQAISSID